MLITITGYQREHFSSCIFYGFLSELRIPRFGNHLAYFCSDKRILSKELDMFILKSPKEKAFYSPS